jgi:hypothetical protein
MLAIVGVGELLALAPWFGASAVAPTLAQTWGLGGLDLPLLTIAVRLGFVAGALLLALTGAADVLSAPRLFFAGAVLAAAANVGFALSNDVAMAVPTDVDWRLVVGAASVSALIGGSVVIVAGRNGPFDHRATDFSLSAARRAFSNPAVRLANLGYLGHMCGSSTPCGRGSRCSCWPASPPRVPTTRRSPVWPPSSSWRSGASAASWPA